MATQVPKLDGDTIQKLRLFARNELTWAEVEGWTFEDACAVAAFGCELSAEGRLEEALIVFEGLTEINPRDAAAVAALGTVYQRLGRSQDALSRYSAAIALDPKQAVALANRGELRLKKGDPDGANDLVAAMEADPGSKAPATRRAVAIVKAMAMAVSGQAAQA